MRLHLLPPALLTTLLASTTTTTTALTVGTWHIYIPTLSDYLGPSHRPNDTPPTHHDKRRPLHRRQSDLDADAADDACPANFNSCAALGAPGVCCAEDASCAVDRAGHVACCPSGLACSGTVGPVVTEGTVDRSGRLVDETGAVGESSGAVETTSFQRPTTAGVQGGDGGLVIASSAGGDGDDGDGDGSSGGDGDGFIVDQGETVAVPGAGARGPELPLIARAVIRVLEYVPL